MTTNKEGGRPTYKLGAMGKEEKQFISDNCELLTNEQIAEKLNRSLSCIKKYIYTLPQKRKEKSLDGYVAQLHDMDAWDEIKKGLLDNEISYFESQWSAYMMQWNNAEIVATDVLMTKDLIMLDISSNRALAEKASVLKLMAILQENIEKELNLSVEARDQISLAEWTNQLNSCRAAMSSLSKEHLDYQNRKDVKLKDLNATREQRFKRIEEMGTNPIELIKELDTIKRRQAEGRLAEKVKIAANKVREDWSHSTQYEDGSWDRPLLTPEGVLKDE